MLYSSGWHLLDNHLMVYSDFNLINSAHSVGWQLDCATKSLNSLINFTSFLSHAHRSAVSIESPSRGSQELERENRGWIMIPLQSPSWENNNNK